MKISYFRGPIVSADREVAPADVRGLTTYTKAYFGDSDVLERSELHDSGKLLRVDYLRAHNFDDTRDFHRRMYPGIPYAIWETREQLPGFVWKHITSVDPSGQVKSYTTLLSDDRQRELMRIDASPSHQTVAITKYYWEDNNLRYVFDYDGTGSLVTGFDLEDGDDVSFSDVRESLPDCEFFEDGFNLPRALAGTAIPADPQ